MNYKKDDISVREVRSEGKPMPPNLDRKAARVIESQLSEAETSMGISTGVGTPEL